MNRNFTPIDWADIRDDFYRLNQELTEIIDAIKPTRAFRLYRVKYDFGSEYVNKGRLYLPDEDGSLIPLTSPKIPTQIKDDLSYNLGSNPASFILNKSAELFMSLPNRTEPVPFALIPPGRLFSTSVVLEEDHQIYHPAFLWNISAGAKTIFMLPKISKAKNYRRLQKHVGFSAPTPVNIFEHHNLFKEIYQQHALGEWKLDIIFFSKKWFENLNTPRFIQFKSYMQSQLHKSSAFWISQYVWDSYFSLINNIAGIRPNPYVYDTVKHILLLSMGILPGLAPAIDNTAAPISSLQEVFDKIYKIDHYLPTIMQLKRFNPYKKNERPIYYSLHCPNAMELAPKSSDNASTILELYEIKNLLGLYLRKLSSQDMNISNTILADIPNLVEFDFFHSTPGNYRDIQDSKTLFEEDSYFANIAYDHSKRTHEYPTTSTIVRGCVRIRKKDK